MRGYVNGRAPVNSAPYGSIDVAEHEEAWAAYARHHSGQSALTIAERGGFGMEELIQQLGRLPVTWRDDEQTRSWWRRYRT